MNGCATTKVNSFRLFVFSILFQITIWKRKGSVTLAAKSEIMSDPSIKLGGGAINEKKRTFGKEDENGSDSGPPYNPLRHRSHLLHAIEGLDRYPNYLSRWGLEDTEMLERALEERLSFVKSQKQQVMERREAIGRLVSCVAEKSPELKVFLSPPNSWQEVDDILDSRIAKAIFKSKQFSRGNPSIQDVINGDVLIELDVGQLQEVMEEEMFDVYSFPLLKPSFCAKLRLFFQRIMEELGSNPEFSGLTRQSTNDLDYIGVGWITNLVFHLVIRPISSHLFKTTEMGGGTLDWRHGYIAAYSAKPTDGKPRQRLVPHTDDSEVTLNICIGEEFEGGKLHFWGLRGTSEEGVWNGKFKPRVGTAILHSGRKFHEVKTVTNGSRYAYIIWCRSWSGMRARKYFRKKKLTRNLLGCF